MVDFDRLSTSMMGISLCMELALILEVLQGSEQKFCIH